METENSSSLKESPAGDQPLYSLRGILVGTFFAGPVAAGMMIRKNFVNLGKPSEGRFALVTSLVLTALVFGFFGVIPESVANAIPSSLFPAVFCAVVYQLVTLKQGDALYQHESVDGPLYSGWRILGVTLASLFITLAMVAATISAIETR